MRSTSFKATAPWVKFLACEDAPYINGVNLPVDSGLHASNGQLNFLSLMGQGLKFGLDQKLIYVLLLPLTP